MSEVQIHATPSTPPYSSPSKNSGISGFLSARLTVQGKLGGCSAAFGGGPSFSRGLWGALKRALKRLEAEGPQTEIQKPEGSHYLSPQPVGIYGKATCQVKEGQKPSCLLV